MRELEKYIDHTLLKADATVPMIEKLCKEAVDYSFHSVCVNGCHVKRAYELLLGTGVRVCCVVGFPLGATDSEVKAFEAMEAVKNGAREIDMVMNVGALKSGLYDDVLKDIKAVVHKIEGKALLKVIIETCLLSREEKVHACKLSVEAGADFVKTSTGFGTGGATKEDIVLMKQAVGERCKVKASGGIRTLDDAISAIDAGADRLGLSASVGIMEEFKIRNNS